jgi:hypothetical protein
LQYLIVREEKTYKQKNKNLGEGMEQGLYSGADLSATRGSTENSGFRLKFC